MSSAQGHGAAANLPVECRILGPLEVRVGGWAVALGGPKQRLILATLLLAAGRTVPADRLIDVVWGEDLSDRVRNTLQVHVSGLRRALQAVGSRLTVVHREPGYAVPVTPQELDLLRFRDLVDAGTTALRDGRPEAAVRALDEALGLWRGPALADLALEPGLAPERESLDAARLTAVGTRVEAQLALGRQAEVVDQLRDLVGEAPLHEHLRALLVRALYGSGRTADALAVLREGRRVLADELGADPSPELRDLERAVLAAEDLRGVEREGQPFLVFWDGGGAQRVVHLHHARSPVTLGRGPNNAVRLSWDAEVSRMHASLEWSRLGWVLTDTSRNGSLVDGREVRGRRVLHDGALLRIGATVLLFRSAGVLTDAPDRTALPTLAGGSTSAVLGELLPVEADVLATVLAAADGAFRSAGSPEELLAEALALPVDDVDAALRSLCRRVGVSDSGPGRVARLADRARGLGVGRL